MPTAMVQFQVELIVGEVWWDFLGDFWSVFDDCKRRTDNHPVLDLPSIDVTRLFQRPAPGLQMGRAPFSPKLISSNPPINTWRLCSP
jgi:hypothetical protein